MPSRLFLFWQLIYNRQLRHPVTRLMCGTGPPLEVDGIDKLDIEFLQPGGSTSSRAAATAVELQFAL